MAVGRRVVRTTTTVKTNIIREHRCLGCGQVYSYEMTVGGSSTSKFGQDQLGATRALADNMKTAVEPIRCPNCKMLQPEMVQAMRQDNREDGIGSLILGALMFVAPMVLFGFWTRFAAIMLMVFALFGRENLQQMNLNPNRDISRKCRLRRPPGAEGRTPLKTWATVLTGLAGLAGAALFAVAVIYPERIKTEDLVIEPGWVYAGDQVEISLQGHRAFPAFRGEYAQEVECSYLAGGETIPLELVANDDRDRDRPSEQDWRQWLGTRQPIQPGDDSPITASCTVRIPETAPADPLGQLSVSWVIEYPRVSGLEIQLGEQMVLETIDLPLRPRSAVYRRGMMVLLKSILGLVGLLSLILGASLVPAAGNIKGFPSTILTLEDRESGSGIRIENKELQHS